jgi:hypothetical protein
VNKCHCSGGKTHSTVEKPIPINQATGGKTHSTVEKPIPINQATGGKTHSTVEKPIPINQATGGKTHSYQSSEYGRPIQKGRSSPYPSTVSQELRMDEEVTKAEPTCRS